MQKVLVTGAAGFIGKALVKELTDRGMEVYAVVNNNRLDTSGIRPDKLHIIQCDLSMDTSEIEALEGKGLDVAYHLAWRGSYGPERCDASIQLENVKMGMDCFKAAQKAGCQKFIAAGTISEFLVMDKEPYGRQIKAISQIYAIAKDCFHSLLEAASYGNSTRSVWCRLSNIYGPDLSISNIISYEIKALASGLVPEFSDALQPYNFIYIKDCIQALIAAGEGECQHNEYFIGGKESCQLAWYLKIVEKQFPGCAGIGIGKRENDGLLYSGGWFDISGLKDDFGFVPAYSFEDGIRETVDLVKRKFKDSTPG